MPRTGRLPKDNPKNMRIQVRLDKEYITRLDECAKRENITKSEVIRKGIDFIYSLGKK